MSAPESSTPDHADPTGEDDKNHPAGTDTPDSMQKADRANGEAGAADDDQSDG